MVFNFEITEDSKCITLTTKGPHDMGHMKATQDMYIMIQSPHPPANTGSAGYGVGLQ